VSSRESRVTGHVSRVTRVTGQLTDGSRGSRVKKYDPLSSLATTIADFDRFHRLSAVGLQLCVRLGIWLKSYIYVILLIYFQ